MILRQDLIPNIQKQTSSVIIKVNFIYFFQAFTVLMKTGELQPADHRESLLHISVSQY